jgi:hypothetical protein
MLYSTLSTAIAFLAVVNGLPQTITKGGIWEDFLDCDHDEWYFENPDPVIHARHRDGFEDLIDTCYYGEWSGSGANENAYGATQWSALDTDGVTPLNDFMLGISFRIWGFCDYEPADEIWVTLKDQWINDGADVADPSDDLWGREREIFRETKNRDNCDGWTQELTGAFEPDWLDEVACTNNNQGVSCFYDFSETFSITSGSRFALRFETSLNNGWNNEAWAYSRIKLTIDPDDFATEHCCTGTRSDKSSKSCSAFGEQTNCEAKGCIWNTEDIKCRVPCCRKIDSSGKDKPKCKTLSDTLHLCGVNPRNDCEQTMCNCNGFWDGLNIPEGITCRP